MSAINCMYAFLCAQDGSRSFEIAGHMLPLCQRCAGVYLGIGLSSLFLLVSRYYRRGLPPRSILYATVAGLLIMPVFGFHLLDPGPLWRLWSGLVFGHGIVLLALPAASIIVRQGRVFGRHTSVSATWFWIFFVWLNAIPLWFPIQSLFFYRAVLLLSFMGILCVAVCAVAAATFLMKKIVVLLAY